MAEILIATNGYKETRSAIEYGAWLAHTLQVPITLLGVTEKRSPAAIDDHHPLEDLFEEAVGLFQERGVEYRLEVQNGEAEQVIPQKANSGDFIVVVSPLGRPSLRRWLIGRSIRLLMEKIRMPILYVPQMRLPLKKMLVSIGGLEYAESAESLAFQIGAACRAETAILHVVPPTDLDYPSAREVWEHADDLLATDTLPARSLRKGLDLARKAGLPARAVIRKGDVVEQILAEIREGSYDLVCMGSPYSARSLRRLYAPNVTAEVAEMAHCPLLTARYQPAETR